jgi:hypothetical protein
MRRVSIIGAPSDSVGASSGPALPDRWIWDHAVTI